MRILDDFAVTVALACCRAFAPLAAAAYLGIDATYNGGLVRVRLGHCKHGSWRALCAIWETRFARETINSALRLGMDDAVLRRVALRDGVEPPSRCILAICHTPWGRVLARWNAARTGVFINAAPRWEARSGGLRIGGGVSGLRQIMREVERGGRVAVVVDCFSYGAGIATRFLNESIRVTPGAARIAAAAGVPLILTVVHYNRGSIRISFGQRLDPRELGVAEATRRIVREFESRVWADPSIWDGIIKHARRSPSMDRRRTSLNRHADDGYRNGMRTSPEKVPTRTI